MLDSDALTSVEGRLETGEVISWQLEGMSGGDSLVGVNVPAADGDENRGERHVVAKFAVATRRKSYLLQRPKPPFQLNQWRTGAQEVEDGAAAIVTGDEEEEGGELDPVPPGPGLRLSGAAFSPAEGASKKKRGAGAAGGWGKQTKNRKNR